MFLKLNSSFSSPALKLAMEANSAEHQLKKAKKKAKERKAKLLMKLRMGMDTPKDIGIDAANAGMEFDMDDGMMGSDGALFSLNRAAKVWIG